MSDYLCEELIIEIFTRLPPKSLLRFRSVSKSLCSCIDSPGFIRKHSSRSPQRLAITHVVKPKYIEEYGDVAFCTLHAEDQLPLMCPIRGYIGTTGVKFPRRLVYVIGSCNGILCLFDVVNGIIILWNPSIMRQLILPDCPRRCIHGLGIGLGFDPVTDDNKIVSIPLFGGMVESPFVYAVKTGAWRPITSPMPLYSKVLTGACYLNGVLHWVVGRWFTDSDDAELRYILTCDLSTHVFGMIALPDPIWGAYQVITIQGSLAVISQPISLVSHDTWIWVRRDDASWSMIFASKTNQVTGLIRVLELSNNGELLLDTFCQGFQVYNPKTRARSSLVNFNDASSLLDIDMYVESLQLLHLGTACEVNHLLLQDQKRANIATSFK